MNHNGGRAADVLDGAGETYAALVDNSMDFIAVGNLDGSIRYVNPAGRDLVGVPTLEAARLLHVLDYFMPGDRAFVATTILPTVEREGAWSGDLPFRDARTGYPIPAAHNVFALTRPDGERFAFAAVSRDLRERQRLEDGLRLLSRTGAAVVDSLDYQRTLRNLAQAFVDGFASYCLIDVMTPHGRWERTVVHRDPSFVPLLTGLTRPDGAHPIARAIQGGVSSFTDIDESWAIELNDPSRGDAVRRLGVRSVISAPVKTPSGDIVGAVTCALDRVSPRENYGPGDLAFVEEVGRRAGAAIANLQLYERERRIALELQSASLPASLPHVDGIVLDAEYRPGSNEAKIGGDWYDAFQLVDKRLVITVGDVIGHGLQAAVLMTKLRLAMQSASMVDADPAVMLRVADRTLRLADPDGYATAIAAIYDPATRVLTLASAGHPGPLLRTLAGLVEEPSAHGTMLGLAAEHIQTFTVAIEPGATLVFYTDGLVEVRRDADADVRLLRDVLARDEIVRSDRPARALVDAVLGDDAARDDIAVLFAAFT